MKSKTIIFTDGAAKGNPGPGGYGAVILRDKIVTEVGGHKERTTNNEMELRAVVEALKAVKESATNVSIYTDSKYVVEGAKGWIFGWVKNGWKTKANGDVLNKELWQELLPLLKQVQIEWYKVPGHVGIIGNERADTIASDFAVNKTFKLFSGPVSDYGFDISNTTYDETKAQERSDARKRQSLKAFSYVSLLDGVVKVHQTWNECEARVKGKKGTRFKKSLDAKNEKEIIRDFSKK
ncbi:MAG TPA: ribonuclease HI [Candidatus Paceibacterota bacterium]|nr:ribonuclease HI [Candidatus Paceibacterota bacterium]HMO82948.1 ribonuclease HI [Candidatus Paceibacterota bacterium]